MEGLLLVNKPPGLTSHDVVALCRRRIGVRRVGHTGTLDPIAQGLLILLVGAATKRQQALQSHEKTYEATITLGTKTETGDAAGRPVRDAPVPRLEPSRVTQVLASLLGPLSQTPPTYSAVKVHGRPAYWWARRQQPVSLPPRTVQLFALTLQHLTPQTITVRVHCSAGTYVRSLAEVIAERLGTVGHLKDLTRLSIGPWLLEDAVPLSWLAESTPEAIAQRLLPTAR